MCSGVCNPQNYTEKRLKTPAHYVETLVTTASLGGNYLLNVGPDGTGRFLPMAVDYLAAIGKWLRANGECIYGTEANPRAEKPKWGYATCREGKVYLIVKDWPEEGGSLEMPALDGKLRGAYLLQDPSKKPLRVTGDESTWTLRFDIPMLQEPFTVVVLDVAE